MEVQTGGNSAPAVEVFKQHFWDAIRLRYAWSIANLPATCPCSSI